MSNVAVTVLLFVQILITIVLYRPLCRLSTMFVNGVNRGKFLILASIHIINILSFIIIFFIKFFSGF